MATKYAAKGFQTISETFKEYGKYYTMKPMEEFRVISIKLNTTFGKTLEDGKAGASTKFTVKGVINMLSYDENGNVKTTKSGNEISFNIQQQAFTNSINTVSGADIRSISDLHEFVKIVEGEDGKKRERVVFSNNKWNEPAPDGLDYTFERYVFAKYDEEKKRFVPTTRGNTSISATLIRFGGFKVIPGEWGEAKKLDAPIVLKNGMEYLFKRTQKNSITKYSGAELEYALINE